MKALVYDGMQKVECREENEITVKIKCELNQLYKQLEEKGFKIADKFTLDDTYFIPKTLKINEMTTREILTKAVIVREVVGIISKRRSKEIMFKTKVIDESGKILSQEKVCCEVAEVEDAKKLLKAIGYKEIMNIKESNIVYDKDGFSLAIKDIENGVNLIEIETKENSKLNTTEKLIQKVNELDIPIYTDSYFVKKAEIELDKVHYLQKHH